MNDEDKKNEMPEVENDAKKTEEVDYVQIVNKRKKREKIIATVAIISLASILGGGSIGLGFGIATSLANKYFNTEQSEKKFLFSGNETIKSPEPTSTTIISNNQDTVSIINNVAKSVVAINTVSTSTTDIFFGLPIQQGGSGSGVIFHQDDEKVYIVTSAHVVSGADSVSITIENSEPIPAKPVGKNSQADLAVVYIEKKDLQAKNISNVNVVSFGDSEQIRVGEKIIAIGNALGEGNSVTSGIISAKNKKINIDGNELSVIQIDAPINVGNSGGPVINTLGEVIGITTAKYAKFTVEGIAYCIASNNVKSVIEEIMNAPTKPYLGIMGINITQKIADEYGLPTIGVFVNSVEPNSSAEKYGLRCTDIITKFNGQTVYTIEELSNLISQCKIGDKIKLHVIRAGKGLDLEIELAQYYENKF